MEAKHPHVTDLGDLQEKIKGNEEITILDVREPAEFAFGHIPGAVNIPLGELENRFEELDKNKEVHIICRTGNRSDLAAQKLAEKGYPNVRNVVPGMTEWKGQLNQTH